MVGDRAKLPVKPVNRLRRAEIIFVGLALAAAYIVARPANTSGQARALPFESVQAGLFSVPNSYSNA